MKNILFVVLVVFSFKSLAIDFFEPSPIFKSKVEKLVLQNAEKIQYFKAKYGFVGVGIITKSFKKMVFYTNTNADYLLSGILIDTQSMQNLSSNYASEFELDLGSLPDDVTKLTGIVQGDGNDEIYAIIDVNCGYCHKTWVQIQAIFDNNPKADLKVHWIPVGFLGQDSISKAQLLVGVKDNKKALQLLKKGMAKKPLVISQDDRLLGKNNLQENEAFMRKNKFGGVPLVIAKTEGKWNLFSGMPTPTFFKQLRNKNIIKDKNVALPGSHSE